MTVHPCQGQHSDVLSGKSLGGWAQGSLESSGLGSRIPSLIVFVEHECLK